MDNLGEEKFETWIDEMFQSEIPRSLSESKKEDYKANLQEKMHYLIKEYNRMKKELLETEEMKRLLKQESNVNVKEKMNEIFFTKENIARLRSELAKIDEKNEIIKKIEEERE